MDRAAFVETRQARLAGGRLRAGALAIEFWRRIANRSLGLRSGRNLHAMGAALAGAMERIVRGNWKRRIVPEDRRVVAGRKRKCSVASDAECFAAKRGRVR